MKKMNVEMKRKIVIAIAPVKDPDTPLPKQCLNPLTPEQVADQTINCAEAGASLVHLHVRDEKGKQTADLTHFSKTLDLIRRESDIIIQGSTGGLSSLSLEERCVSVDDDRVEMASLNMGSTNFSDDAYINTLPDIRYWARRMLMKGIVPECEIFDLSMISTTRRLADEGLLRNPIHYGFALGFESSLDAKPYNLFYLRSLIPPTSTWGLVHNGMKDFTLIACAVSLGATVIRVGFEDSVHYSPNVIAESNVTLVKKIHDLVNHLGLDVAKESEAREILLNKKQ
jgi:3-keto-5-aminohexanoate cleavage enzyme